MQTSVELHSGPNVSTLQSSVFIRGDLKSQHHFLYTQEQSDPLSSIFCDTKHVIAWENSKIITTNNRFSQRRCLEAWHINMNHHALNRDDGSYLPQEYFHLVGK